MKNLFRSLTGAVTTAAVFAALAKAGAETCTLQLKRLEPLDPARADSAEISDHLYRDTRSQSFHMRVRSRGQAVPPPAPSAEFSAIVKKQPGYESEYALRGVAKLGTHQYAFALDVKPPESESTPSETAPKPDPEAARAEQEKPKSVLYDRLYFDLNRNGDLTDDGVIEAEANVRRPSGSAYAQATFPRVDVTIDVDGAKLDYAVLPRVSSRCSQGYASTEVYLKAAAYREGEIVLEGKTRHVAVVDFNCNGRFDDEFAIRRTASGRIYGGYGDVLLVDPDPKPRYLYFFVGFTAPDGRHPVSKLVPIDGRFYNVKISPVGDRLTLTPASAPVGHVTSPSAGFCAIVYNDRGCLKIGSQEKSKPIPLPEGDWKLLNYTIDRTRYEQPEEGEEGVSLSQVVSLTPIRRSPTPNLTLISARTTDDCKPVKVRQGQTAALPFGPPYKPVVKVASGAGKEVVRLQMSLVGSGGEVCSNLRVERMSPKDPEFTISTSEGKEVASGKFEWG